MIAVRTGSSCQQDDVLAVSLELQRNLLSRGMMCNELLEFFCASSWKQGNYLAETCWKCGRFCMGRVRKVAFVTVIKISLYFYGKFSLG